MHRRKETEEVREKERDSARESGKRGELGRERKRESEVFRKKLERSIDRWIYREKEGNTIFLILNTLLL